MLLVYHLLVRDEHREGVDLERHCASDGVVVMAASEEQRLDVAPNRSAKC